jgi:hypothetical protein
MYFSLSIDENQSSTLSKYRYREMFDSLYTTIYINMFQTLYHALWYKTHFTMPVNFGNYAGRGKIYCTS